ncbi:MAG: hypothetical protein M1830_009840 [Pleopsidium flavum]|nr:MAG: hypothetical protein M1830_009840 [Pleopsidium flavum]
MAASQKLYPRATLKRIIKAHSKRNVSKNVDVLVCNPSINPSLLGRINTLGLGRVLVLLGRGGLIREASIHAKRTGERGITARSVRRVTEV